MVNFPVKALMGVGVAGAVGLGGYGIYAFSQKSKTIEEMLNEEGRQLLSFEGEAHKDEWESKITKYSNITDGTPKLIGYEATTPLETEANKKLNREKMQSICKKLVKESSSDSSKLNQAREWCTKVKAGD